MPSRQPPIVLTMPGAAGALAALPALLACEAGTMDVHVFPDGESCPRVPMAVEGRDVVLLANLDQPDPKIMALYLSACTARELGARSVGLVLPYLPYMRQDAKFQAGQGITSRHFAALLSSCCNWLVTVDPHLHRHPALSNIYTVPSVAVHAAPVIAAWIAEHVERPIVVGPDGESEQWAAEVAGLAGCPMMVLHKMRNGDRDVAVSAAGQGLAGRTPVLVDDIISTARTMIAATQQLHAAGARAPLCVGVHALFVGDAMVALAAAGAGDIVSCNSVVHATNRIDLAPALAAAIRQMLVEN